jgi:hypothetical protein
MAKKVSFFITFVEVKAWLSIQRKLANLSSIVDQGGGAGVEGAVVWVVIQLASFQFAVPGLTVVPVALAVDVKRAPFHG